jgi:general secretion pathway protein L
MKPVRLILVPPMASAPAPYLVIGGDGVVRERGVLTPDQPGPAEVMRTVAVAPGADVTIRWLDLAPGGEAQVRAAAAWKLREAVAGDLDRLVTVVGAPTPAGTPRLAAVVSRALLGAWVDYLAELGVRADVIVPDVLTLPEPGTDGVLIAAAFGDAVALRGRQFAATVQPDLTQLVAGDRLVEPIEDPLALERLLIAAARAPALNLLDRASRSPERVGSWRRAAALAAAVVVSPLVLVLAAAARDDLAARRMHDEARALIVAQAPDLVSAPDPVAALRARSDALPPPGGPVAAAAALYAALEGVEGAELDILISDPGEGMKATLTHPNYADIERVRAALAPAGMTVVETGTADEGGRVVSDITVGGLS